MSCILLRTAFEVDVDLQRMTTSDESIWYSVVAASGDSGGCTMYLPRRRLSISTARDTIIPFLRNQGSPPSTKMMYETVARPPVVVTAKKQERVSSLSSSRGGRRLLKRRRQPTPTQPLSVYKRYTGEGSSAALFDMDEVQRGGGVVTFGGFFCTPIRF